MTSSIRYSAGLISLFLMTTTGNAQENSNALSYSLGISYLDSNLDGFLQTPAGGEPGSTSNNRPSFEELGFDRQSAINAFGRIAWKRHTLELGGQWQRQSGKSVLEKDLISQKHFFAAGSRVDADVQTDWYRLNYLYALNAALDNLSFSVGGGLVWFDFHYKLRSTTAKADRAYSKVGYRAGANIDWKLNDKLLINTRLFAPIPLSNTPEIWTVEMNAAYEFWNSGSNRLQAIAGVGYNRLDYEDNQKVPNHIRVEMAPYFRLGLKMDF